MMTAQEVKDLSSNYRAIADALVDYRTAHPFASDAERDMFNRTVGDIRKTAEDLMNEALQLASVDIGASVEGLKDATTKAAAAVKVVDNITKAFSIAGAAIELGATILHPTPGAVVGALDTLVQSIQKAAAKPAGAGSTAS
ncbi:MAG: hypothetical protein WB579_18165 [Bryobacteraceae bacterium]